MALDLRFWIGALLILTAACGDDGTTGPSDSSAGVDAADAAPDAAPDTAVTDTRPPVMDGSGPDSSEPDDVPSVPAFGSEIGVVGCSNTNQATEGYLAASTVDALFDTAQGGQAMTEWSVTSGGPWTRYDAMRPAAGYSSVWLNLCQRAADGLDQTIVDTVIANIRSRDPSVPIVISPLNFYEEETCGVTNGNEIPNAGATLADATAAADPMVFRGPDLGPVGPSMLRMDDCHLNAAGIALVGSQLVAFFD